MINNFIFRDEYLFNFDNTFEIHDDIEVLKRMGMTFGLEKGQCSQADLNKSLKMVPKALEPYVLGKKKPCFVKHTNHEELRILSFVNSSSKA